MSSSRPTNPSSSKSPDDKQTTPKKLPDLNVDPLAQYFIHPRASAMSSILNTDDPQINPQDLVATAGIPTHIPPSPPSSGEMKSKKRLRDWHELNPEDDNAGASDAIEPPIFPAPVAIRPVERSVVFRDPVPDAYDEEDGLEDEKFLFESSRNQEEDDYSTLKLLLYIRSRDAIFPPNDLHAGRCRRKERELGSKYASFVNDYGDETFTESMFPTRIGYVMYRMSRYLWGNVVPRLGSGSSSVPADPNVDVDVLYFDPDAPFFNPDRNKYPYDFDPDISPIYVSSPEPVSEDDPVDAKDDPVDPLYYPFDVKDDPYDDDDDQIVAKVRASFAVPAAREVPVTRRRSVRRASKPPKPVQEQPLITGEEYDRQLAYALQMSYDQSKRTGQTSGGINTGKPPRPPRTGQTSGGTQIVKPPVATKNAIPLKKRIAKPRSVSKRRGKRIVPSDDDDTVAEEYEFFLPFSESEEDDDYEALKFLLFYVLEGRIHSYHGNLRRVLKDLTDFISSRQPSIYEISIDKCRKKLMELRDKFDEFEELHGTEDIPAYDFADDHQYEMLQMNRIVWSHGLAAIGAGFGIHSDTDDSETDDDAKVDPRHDGADQETAAVVEGGKVDVDSMDVEGGKEDVDSMEVDGGQ